MTNLTQFDGTLISFIERDGEQYLTAPQIGAAIGYKRPRKILELYNRYKQEFDRNMTRVAKIDGKMVRIFNRRGAHLLAMFSKTPKAAAFRQWILDVLAEHTQKPVQKQVALPAPKVQISEGQARYALLNLNNAISHCHTLIEDAEHNTLDVSNRDYIAREMKTRLMQVSQVVQKLGSGDSFHCYKRVTAAI